MLAILWYCVGCFSALILLVIGYNFARISDPTRNASDTVPRLPTFKKSPPQRRKPKSISELDQWKREQKDAPLDPGIN